MFETIVLVLAVLGGGVTAEDDVCADPYPSLPVYNETAGNGRSSTHLYFYRLLCVLCSDL